MKNHGLFLKKQRRKMIRRKNIIVNFYIVFILMEKDQTH